MKKRKVLINGSMIDDSPTGVGIVSINIINQIPTFNKAGIWFTVFTPSRKLNLPGIYKISNLLRADKYPKLSAIIRFFWNQINLTLYGLKYDICYSPTTHGSIFLNNQIITIHDLICLNYPNNHKFQYYYFKYVIPIYIKKSLKIITISEFTKRELIKFYKCDPNKIVVVYNGFTQNAKPLKNTNFHIVNYLKTLNKKSFILTVGATYKHKNIETILKAFKFSKSKCDNLLVIVGATNSYIESLKNICSELNLNNDVLFVGYVSNEELAFLYKNAKLMVYLSLYEGFGLPILEALSHKCPVLASDIPVFHEICGNSINYVNPLDVNAISKSMDNLLLKNYFNDIEAEKTLNRYSWDSTAKKILTIINNQCNTILRPKDG